MPNPKTPIELESLKSKNKNSSSATGTLLATVLGGLSAIAIYFLFIKDNLPDQSEKKIASTASVSVETETSPTTPEIEEVESPRTGDVLDDQAEQVVEDSPPLIAEKPELTPIQVPELTTGESATAVAVAEDSDKQSKDSTDQQPEAEEEKPEREEIKLAKRRWKVLLLLQDQMGESPIPDKFPIWNYEKGYSFSGSGADSHRLGNYKIDGEFIIRDGYLRREFGNSALLHLPKAENFELEGLISVTGSGGWMMLLGWDIEKKSGYVVYNTKLRVSGSHWFVIEIKDGKPVSDSERNLVQRDAAGEGALHVLIDEKKISMQSAGNYLFRDELLPNYKEGHVAIGTFSPQYGPQNIGIKSLRMRLR